MCRGHTEMASRDVAPVDIITAADEDNDDDNDNCHPDNRLMMLPL